MENYDTTKFTQFELNIIELFERLQSATVTAEENGVYYTDDGYENGYTKGALLEHCIHGINHWYSETDIKNMLNNDFILENAMDYLQLLLNLPSDTTVLAVGNGAVAAPTTTTAYLHEDYHGNKLLAVYDYEANEEETKKDLCELFPQTPPQWEIIFAYENADYNYPIIVGAEDRTEALKKGLDIFNNECEWHYMPWEQVNIRQLTETETEENPTPAEYADIIAVANSNVRKAITETMNKFSDCYTVTSNISESQEFELDIATNHIVYAVADSVADALNIK